MHTCFLVGKHIGAYIDWQSLLRPAAECIQVQEFVSRKNPVLISKSLVGSAFPMKLIRRYHHYL